MSAFSSISSDSSQSAPGGGEGTDGERADFRPGMGMMVAKPKFGRWMVPVLVLAAVLAHGMALNADFYMDDENHILTRETGRVLEGVDYRYRWVTSLAWDGIYAVAGASSVAFHAFNLFLHLAVVVSVFEVGKRLMARLGSDTKGGMPELASFIGALLFATHPVLTEGVNYAQNASLQLVTLFTVGAVGCSLRFFVAGRMRWLLGVVACVVASAFTKEVGLIYCGVSVGLVWMALGNVGGSVTLGGPLRRSKYLLLGLVPLAAYFLWYGGTMFFRVIQAPMWAEHFFTQGRLFWSYLWMMVWPANLCADHLVPFSRAGMADPVAFSGTVAVGLAMAALVAGLWLGRARGVCLLLLLGALPLVLRLVYINNELLVEYRVYPAFPWIALAAGSGGAALYRRFPKATGVALTLVVGMCVVTSVRRSMVWSDAYQLALDNIRHYPHHLRARTHLQRIDLLEGNWQRVMEVRDDTRRAFDALQADNAAMQGTRFYETFMRSREYLCSEHFYAIALAETEGSQKALAHTTDVLRHIQEATPGLAGRDREYAELTKQIVEIHTVLRDHGAEYDQRRQARAAESRQSQAAK